MPHESMLKSTLITPIDVPTTPGSWPSFAETPYPPVTHNTFQSEFYAGEHQANLVHPLRHRDSLSSSSGSSFSGPASPVTFPAPKPTISPSEPGQSPSTADPEDADDAPWNLVAYHIPWGSSYAGYKAGTLPGPEGACIFLRSPTPTKRQRTSQACEKCRERKAKCSGTRPSCARCTARGHDCFYSPTPILGPSSATDEAPASLHAPSRHSRSFSSNLRVKTSAKRTAIRRKMSNSSWSGGEDPLPSPLTFETSSPSPLHAPRSASSNSSFDTLSTSSFGTSLDVFSPLQFPTPLTRGRGHTFSSPGIAQYGDCALGLDVYRFPPMEDGGLDDHAKIFPSLGDIKEVPLALAHPQPQPLRCRASMPQLSYPYDVVPAPDMALDWFTGGAGAAWDGEFEFPDPEPPMSATTAASSSMLFSSRLRPESHAHAHPVYPDLAPPDFSTYEPGHAEWMHEKSLGQGTV